MALALGRRLGESLTIIHKETGQRIEIVFSDTKSRDSIRLTCVDDAKNFNIVRTEILTTKEKS